jgi:hypothetical protein
MGELVFGLVLLAAGILSAFLTRRADRRRLQLMEAFSPNAEHPGVIKYAKTSRLLYIVLCVVIGLGFLVFGIVNLLS